MATISLTRNYHDGEVYTQAEIDAPYDDIETFLNVTKINDDNIQNNGITGSLKLLTGSVSTGKIADAAITTSKLADQAVTAAKIATASITETQMGPLSVGTPELIDASVTTVKILDANVTAAKLAADVTALLQPPGLINPFGGTVAPTGWLPCDGSSVLQTDFPALFTAIGTAYGSADASHFNVPDLRGQFLRGADTFGAGSASRDPDKAGRTAMNTGGATGDNVGSVQTNQVQSHTHTATAKHSPSAGSTAGAAFSLTNSIVSPYSTIDATYTDLVINSATGGNETRPINAYVNYIIKT